MIVGAFLSGMPPLTQANFITRIYTYSGIRMILFLSCFIKAKPGECGERIRG